MATAGTPLRFNGAKSAVVPAVPLVNQAAEPAWVGEGGVIPTIRGTVSGTPITAYKLAGIAPITKELENSSAAAAVMRQLLRQATANLLDRSLLDASAPA